MGLHASQRVFMLMQDKFTLSQIALGNMSNDGHVILLHFFLQKYRVNTTTHVKMLDILSHVGANM